jgi:DNA-binding protein YbaB
MIKINMNKAKEIKKSMLRSERESLLKDLDVAYMRALEANDPQALVEIAAQKQALRDITVHPDLVNAEDVEVLKNLKIEDLV